VNGGWANPGFRRRLVRSPTAKLTRTKFKCSRFFRTLRWPVDLLAVAAVSLAFVSIQLAIFFFMEVILIGLRGWGQFGTGGPGPLVPRVEYNPSQRRKYGHF
jgi:hypothetical protein